MYTKSLISLAVLSCQAVQALEIMDIKYQKYNGEDLRDPTLINEDDPNFREYHAQAPEVYGWFKGPTYRAKTRQEKMEDLWGQVMKDTQMTEMPYKDFGKVFTQVSNGSFCQNSDELQNKRVKVNHAQGVVGQINWQSTMDHPFTGTFASGSDTAVIRFSETTLLNDASKGLLPSVAVKFLIDGRSSNNVFGMPSFKSSDSWDFFSQPMKSQVDPFTEDMTVEMETIFVKLLEGSVQPFGTGTAHVADQNNDGTEVTDVKTPFMLEFESSIHFPDTKQDDQMWYDQLMTIENGTTIMEVYGWTAPQTHGGERVKMADLVLTSDLTTSKFGDERLHFQHKRQRADFIHYDSKDWKEAVTNFTEEERTEARLRNGTWDVSAWPNNNTDAKAMLESEITQNNGCPFAWLLKMM